MTYGAEGRAFIVLLVVGGLIALLFVWLPTVGDDDVDAVAPATTTEPTVVSTTTTEATLEDLNRQLCSEAKETAKTFEPLKDNPAVVARVMNPFMEEAVVLTSGFPDVTAEFIAAANFYHDYDEVGAPFDYDSERILLEGDGLRWEILNTSEPAGVAAIQQVLKFVCDVDIPNPPSIDPEVFEDIKKEHDLGSQGLASDIRILPGATSPTTTPTSVPVPGE